MKAKAAAAAAGREQEVAESETTQLQLADGPSLESGSERVNYTSNAVACTDATWTIGSRQNES